MSAPVDVLTRIEEIETELHELTDEVQRLRALVSKEAEATVPRPAPAPPPRHARAVPTPPPSARPAHAQPARPAPASPVAARPAPEPPVDLPAPLFEVPRRRGLGDLARDWELLGPRGFAIVGGAVTALGVILLFVLAANRGWITPAMRVGIGAAVSCAAVGLGLWVRARFGRMQASLGAVGAGIAGCYASLAAASARYDLVPDWLALPFAGVIAAVAVAVALAWSAELVAAIGLLAAAFAPGLQAIDTGMTWPAAAFAVIVLAAAAAVSVPRRWSALLVAVAAVVAGEVAWLAHATHHAAGAGDVAVVAALVLVGLAAAVWLQLATGAARLDAFASTLALASAGSALLLTRQLFADDSTLGLSLLVAAAVWAGTWAALRRTQPSLALVLGVSALALASVATADLLSGTGLALTWAAESVLLSLLAQRLRDVRLQVTALAYAGLAGAAAVRDVPPDTIFHDPVAASAAVSFAAVAVALSAAGALAPAATEPRDEEGLLAWIATVRLALGRVREPLRDWLLLGAAALGTYAASLSLVSLSYRDGHLAATALAAAVGASATALAAQRRSTGLVAAGLAWLAATLAVAAAYDVPEFARAYGDRSFGGWAVIAAAAGVLAGAYACGILLRGQAAVAVPAAGMPIALVASVAGIALLSPVGDVLESTWIGWRMLVPALVLGALAAPVFRTERLRDLATIGWALGVLALVGAEWLVLQETTWRVLGLAATAAALAALSRLLGEPRLWSAAAILLSVTTAGVIAGVIPPSRFLIASASPAAGLWAGVFCLAAGAVLRVTGPARRAVLDPLLAVGGLYVLSLGILELAERALGGSIEADFDRGHVTVSALWALIGLALLVAGLVRDTSLLRFGGLALFGLSLAKIFLYDLSTLSSVARAFSFIAVGGLVLVGGFFLQRLSAGGGGREPSVR